MSRLRVALPPVLLAAMLAAVLAALPLGVASARPAAVEPARRLDGGLAARLATTAPDRLVGAIVVLRSQSRLTGLPGSSRRDRLRSLEQRLRATAADGQRDLLGDLSAEQAAGTVTHVTPLWIRDAVSLRATPAVLRRVAARPDVAEVLPDQTVAAPAAAASVPAATIAGPAEANVAAVGAPAMWNLGFRGQGVVVASMDTGVDATAPDLASRWRGGQDSWYDPNGEHPTTPTDVNGHGTQTLSVAVGGDAGGSSVGVAPDARWIAVKIFNDRGVATSTGIHLGFQWLLDPDHDPATADAPNVVNDSWTLSSGTCALDFQPDLRALRAGGILPVFAAGNSGPTAGTVASPADNPEALAVGGVDGSDAIDPYSSRGPSACTGATAPYLVAPDTGIRAADLYGGYVQDTGTSVAAPHVTGTVALLLSALPSLKASPDTVQAALQQGATDLGPAGLDTSFGYGRVDALAAYQWVNSISDFGLSVSPGSAATTAGGSATYSVTVAPSGKFTADVALGAAGLPAGATATFTPASVTGGAGTAQLTVSTAPTLTPGSYPFTVTGTAPGVSHSAAATLVVSPPPDFGLAVSPASRTVNAGTSTTYAATVSAANGFAGDVALSVVGLPAEVGTWKASPASVPGAGSSTVTVSTLSGAPAGTYHLTLTGTSGALSHSVPLTLVVPARDFSLSASPLTASVTRGQTATYTLTVKRTGGFTGPVTLSLSGAPARTTVTWSANPVTGATATLKVATTSTTTRATYSLVVSGTGGSHTHTAKLSLTVR